MRGYDAIADVDPEEYRRHRDPREAAASRARAGMDGQTPALEVMLDFERAHPGHRGSKEELIRRHLHISVVRYYQALHRLCGLREALEHDPQTTHRVNERREAAAARRAARSANRWTRA